MFGDIDLQRSFFKSLKEVKNESLELRNVYDSFFDFNIILTSDVGAKTLLNREYIYQTNDILKERTAIVNAIFDEIFLSFKRYIKEKVPNINGKITDLSSFIFDNERFLNSIYETVQNKDSIQTVKDILFIKDKMYNLKYIISKSNTLSVCKKLNKFTMNELKDSQSIFSVLDHLGLLTNHFNEFYSRLEKIEYDYVNKLYSDLNFLDNLISYESLKVEEFVYANRKVAFILDYQNLSKTSDVFYLDKDYLENIISSLIEQSCLDIIKKEKYSSKGDRHITVKVDLNKRYLTVSVISDGLDISNFDTSMLYVSENKGLVQAKNLLSYINGKLEVINTKDEGIEYKATIKVEKKNKTLESQEEEEDNQEESS